MLFTERLSHEIKKHIIILTVLFVASAVLGYYAATSHPEEASKLLGTILRDIKERIDSLDKPLQLLPLPREQPVSLFVLVRC